MAESVAEQRSTNVKSKSTVNKSLGQDQSSCPRYTCERCKAMVRPLPDSVPDCKTHLLAGLLFIIGLPFFCFLPYCFDCCGKSVKRCPQCGAFMDDVDTNANANVTTNPSSQINQENI